MKTTIITHPGRAHRDDFLAVCWLLGDVITPPEVYRREPSQADLDDATVYVLDIGGRYDPSFRNFDHHQFPADSPPTCALQLLLEHDLGLTEAHEAFPWLYTTGLIDSKGIVAAAAHYGVPLKLFSKGGSPVESMMLEWFASVSFLNSKHVLHQVMTNIGLSMWERATHFNAAKDQVNVELRRESHNSTLFDILVADEATKHMTYPTYLPEIMELNCKAAVAQGADPIASISPSVDGRGEGWTLYRYNDNKCIDFKLIRNHPKVTFVHANGFLAKVNTDVTRDELIEMVKLSYITPMFS